ncbi:MAG: diaminopimelate decarboxylase [Candidatus Eremiobacteraeota bacterium]|nr:diaminopimelate decarboxylase [Candidatus Eremiobacteraeota bacterium]
MNRKPPRLLGGVSVNELVARYGTPLLVIDGAVLAASIEAFTSVAGRAEIEVSYAGKALLLVGLAQLLQRTRLRLEVCSLGELATAERAGFPSERMDLHGCGKTDEELMAAADHRVARTIVDNVPELKRLASLAKAASPIRVLLRLNTGVRAHTHSYVRTAGEQSKFGMLTRDLPSAAQVFHGTPALHFCGLHSHVGSQISEQRIFVENAKRLLDAAARFQRLGFTTSELVVGGGFAVSSRPSDRSTIDIRGTLNAIATAVRKQSAAHGIPLPTIGIEPGRAVISPAGTLLYRVLVRKSQRRQSFLVVDGGMADNPRPALYGAHPVAELAARASRAPLEKVRICGRSCENDFITDARLPKDVTSGDILSMPMTGAYTYSMASNYNRFPRPAVAYARDGEHSLLARRETLDDVMANDVPLTG